MQYGMLPGVYLADIEGDLVLLDSRADAYFCVPRDLAMGLKTALTGNNRFRPSGEMIDALEAAGLFGTIDAPARYDPPAIQAITDLDALPGGRRRWTPLLAARLCLAAAYTLRLGVTRPCRWLASVARRKGRATKAREVEDVYRIARAARAAQPLFPGLGDCLPSSMFLIDLLLHCGVRTRWVFGVRTYPFEAHCWVEHEGVVLNDSLEHVRWFTPIVAV